MQTYRESAEQWGQAYREHERSNRMGRAMQLADRVYEAVARGKEARDEVEFTQREILAGAISEIRAQAQEELRAELLAEARSLVAGAVRIAHKELESIANKVQSGEHFGAGS